MTRNIEKKAHGLSIRKLSKSSHLSQFCVQGLKCMWTMCSLKRHRESLVDVTTKKQNKKEMKKNWCQRSVERFMGKKNKKRNKNERIGSEKLPQRIRVIDRDRSQRETQVDGASSIRTRVHGKSGSPPERTDQSHWSSSSRDPTTGFSKENILTKCARVSKLADCRWSWRACLASACCVGGVCFCGELCFVG